MYDTGSSTLWVLDSNCTDDCVNVSGLVDHSLLIHDYITDGYQLLSTQLQSHFYRRRLGYRRQH